MTNNLDTITDEDLTIVAMRAFSLGLDHGRIKSGPIDADKLLTLLFPEQVPARRKGHTSKLRQVYGAGFDISAMMKSIASK